MFNVKVGDPIVYIRFSIDENYKVEKEYEQYKILGISESYIVLDNEYFTHIANNKTFHFTHLYLNEAKCSKGRLLSSYPERIECWCYSTSLSKKVNVNRIKKGLREFIEKDKWLYNSLESIIDKIEF